MAAGGRLPVRGKPTRRRSGATALFVSDGDNFAPRRELLLSAVTKVAKSTGRNCVSALPQRAMPGSDLLRILADIAFHHRCRSKGLCLHSFPLPLPVTTVKLFVLPCRRLRNNYILCPTGTPTFAALRRQRRDLIIAHPVEANTPTVAEASGRGSLRAGERRHSPFDRQ